MGRPSNHLRSACSAGIWLALLLCSTPTARGETTTSPPASFIGTNQPIFPAGNLNVFKQYVLKVPNLQHRVDRQVSIPLGFDTLRFGGSLTGALGGRRPFEDPAAFGLELGLCFGGRAEYNLNFCPSVTLPDAYPYDIPLPLTVSEGFQSESSSFTTQFPPLGKAYADLIFEVGFEVKAEASVFGTTRFGFPPLTTCNLPPPVDKFFKLSTRCDSTLTARPYCSLELMSWNRNDDACLRMLNVFAPTDEERAMGLNTWFKKFLAEPHLEKCPNINRQKSFQADKDNDRLTVTGFLDGEAVEVSSAGTLPGGLRSHRQYYVINASGGTLQLSERRGGLPIDITSNESGGNHAIFTRYALDPEDNDGGFGGIGKISFAAATVETDSRNSTTNTEKVLRSSGSEDVMGLGLDMAALLSQFLPAPIPPLSDAGSIGPINWNYNIASLNLGPAIKLQTDFEMTWDIEVTGMTFTTPEPPAVPTSLTLYWPSGSPRRAAHPSGEQVMLTGNPMLQFAEGTVQLTSCGPKALPMIELSSMDPVEIHIDYKVTPMLKTVVSVPIIGQIDYQLLEAGASISRVGGIGFGPLVDDAHKFKFGEFNVYKTDHPRPLQSRTATFSFIMQAAGPPSFEWSPGELTTAQTYPVSNWFHYLDTDFNGEIVDLTNWHEVTDRNNPLRGDLPGISSHAGILDVPPGSFDPSIFNSNGIKRVPISSLQVGEGRSLTVGNNSELTLQGGLLENSGTINMNSGGGFWGSTLRMASPDGVLCGDGDIVLTDAAIRGVQGVESSFCNYNTIRGAGQAMDRYAPSPYDLFHLWDFENIPSSDLDNVDPVDSVSGVVGELQNGATIAFQGGARGHVLQLGPGADSMEVSNATLFNLAAARDQMTVCFWQKLDPAGVATFKTNFLAESPTSAESAGFRVHAPWSNQIVYFDTSGCCGSDTRINTGTRTENFAEWHHFAFVKDGATKQIWIDGVLVLSGVNTKQLSTDIGSLWIGSAAGGARSVHGLLDDVALFGLPLDATAIGLLHSGTRPEELPFSGEGAHSTVNNMGIFCADSGNDGLLSTSAQTVINQGLFEARADSGFLAYGGKLTTSVGSTILSEGKDVGEFTEAEIYLSFDEAEHAGLIQVRDGAYLNIGSFNYERSEWRASLSSTADVGFFRSELPLSNLEFSSTNLTGGCLIATSGGTITASDSDFTGSMLQIGDIDDSRTIQPDSGYLHLWRDAGAATPGSLRELCLINDGTVEVDGSWRIADSILFANNATIQVNAGGSLIVEPNIIASPGASDTAMTQPGSANATGESTSEVMTEAGPMIKRRQSLLGGTWDIAGHLEFAGASFTALGANSVPASTGRGSIDDLGGADREVQDDPEEGFGRQLSEGAPATVILRGPAASFPSLQALEENRGSLQLWEGTDFTVTPSNPLVTAFTNKNELTIDNGSTLTVEGGFLQCDGGAKTNLANGGGLLSTTGDFQFLAGTLTVDSSSEIFGDVASGGARSISGGSKVRIEAQLVDTGTKDPFGVSIWRQSPMEIDLGAPLTGIEAGASLVIKGSMTSFRGSGGIYFPELATLNSIAGTLRLEGDGFPYSPELTLNDVTNTGQVEIVGRGCTLRTGAYTQNGGSLRIGADARVEFGGGSLINAGELVVEISERPRGTRRAANFPELQPRKLGPINVEAGFSFNNKLVIDFTGDLAQSTVDIGDRWQIVPRGETVTGFTSIDYRLDGTSLPLDWLPVGAELQTFQYRDDFGGPGTGLGIRVAPAAGLQAYGDWAVSGTRNFDPTAPFFDGNGNGEIDLREYFFGLEGRERSFAERYLQTAFIVEPNPNNEEGADNFLEFSYVRPRPDGGPSPDASYIPYFSLDLQKWIVAPMVITAIAPGPELDLEQVTLRSTAPVTEERLFVRIQPSYNPDDFEPGLIPEKPLQWSGNFVFFDNGSFQQTIFENSGLILSYGLEPGRVLFLNIATADAGSPGTRNIVGTDVYHQESVLEAAVIHAGALGNGDSGIVKVTFRSSPASFTGSVRNEGTNDQVTSTDSPLNPGPNDLSYTIELVASQTGN